MIVGKGRTAPLRVFVLLPPLALLVGPGSVGGQPAPAPAAAQSQAPRPTRALVSSASQPAPGPVVVATLKELMDSTVDPAADAIWDAVSVRATKQGVEYRQPRTAEEWAALRRHALTLIESMNLVALPGRHAAPPGTKPGLGELDPAQIERDIAQKRPLFASLAQVLQGTAQHALEAIDRKDTAAVVKTGGDIDAACEACHVTFWYPNQR